MRERTIHTETEIEKKTEREETERGCRNTIKGGMSRERERDTYRDRDREKDRKRRDRERM